MRTPAERYRDDPYFHMLVSLFYREFEKSDGSGAGLTPTEIREASAFAWQMYAERRLAPLLLVRPPS